MHTASYNLHDDRLKLFLDQGDRIPREEYLALKKLGLAWWRGSKCLSGIWTPEREDAILAYVDDIEFLVDDDCGLAYRLERFGGYAGNAAARAEAERHRLDELLDPIPPGQPILVGHHSERHARRVQKLAHAAMRRVIWEQDKAGYWAERQKAAERHAAYKERPEVIWRRIERFEADLRRWEREMSDEEKARWVLRGNDMSKWEAHLEHGRRWVEHLQMVLDYQRELYRRSGGTAVDRGEVILEVGGAIKNRYPNYWVPILRVNAKSVTVLDTYRWEERPFTHAFTRTVPKAEIRQALSADAYRAHEHYAIGQALIAAYKQMSRPDLAVEKGGAARIRYVTGGGLTDWMHVVRVNQKTLSVLRWSSLRGGDWIEDKIARRDVSETMSAEAWSAHVAGQAEKGEDARWARLLERIK
jgi:hypothetical protein